MDQRRWRRIVIRQRRIRFITNSTGSVVTTVNQVLTVAEDVTAAEDALATAAVDSDVHVLQARVKV